MRNRLGGVLIWIGTLLMLAGWVIFGPALSPAILPFPAAPQSATPVSTDPPLTPTFTPTPYPTPTPAPTPTPIPTPTPPPPTPTPVPYLPTRVVIPSVGIDAPVVPTHWETQEVAGALQPVWIVPDAPYVGWHETSAPLGRPGNTVLNGHNWPENGPFRLLYKAQIGDTVILYSGAIPFVYRIAEVLLLPEAGQPLEVRQANARYIQPTDDERVTLVTCHPYGSTRFRLIVIARPDQTPRHRRILEEP